ncbi:hypothetical protein K437DRAFT_266020 [Tilletiaria anomala UBC 951]|uniref:Formyl transferase C-terminal domain-containing protein n=1 Tax=Tilletiaria anomala (strain ATCC 24038 / CBS 436.72 / UBC 951) TaxID=1037660 RepID=A0A066WR13_TILAU|nr:uncharacterized protein K437DRAFT_266020 [Tilletiaria anomala UBC 951]KDN53085.1 hypothetical protein K437DRAFT_266020 [Tilletiaria anomala UBC 951]
MKILFLCTAFNSLSQRLALVLRQRGHAVTVELALDAARMIDAVALAAPDLILCPFLTKRVPPQVYNSTLTLILHPGPPGDAGPSAIDLALFGDTGELAHLDEQLAVLALRHAKPGVKRCMRSHWGVTCLQAIEAFDAGPIWGFDQFALDDETARMSKSELYRGPITSAAIAATLVALERIAAAHAPARTLPFPVDLVAPAEARSQCASRRLPFQGGTTRDRPLLKASARDFVPLIIGAGSTRMSAEAIVQRVNSADSQPGVLSALLFGTPLFLYDAHVQTAPLRADVAAVAAAAAAAAGTVSAPIGTVLAIRDEAVLVECGADYPIWFSQLRRPKAKADRYLHPKLPATRSLADLAASSGGAGNDKVTQALLDAVDWRIEENGHDAAAGRRSDDAPWRKVHGTYQQIWVEMEAVDDARQVAYVYFDFYNGATSTTQCLRLRAALDWVLAQPRLAALVLMGGSAYFSNGIALNVIEGAGGAAQGTVDDAAQESWDNINAIDDVVQPLLLANARGRGYAGAGVLTFAALRGNAAAGGLALADACDVVLASEHVVLNPHYRGLGLYGSEYHTFSWAQRSSETSSGSVHAVPSYARTMLPMSVEQGVSAGLVDHVVPHSQSSPLQLVEEVKQRVRMVLCASVAQAQAARRDGSSSVLGCGAVWTRLRAPRAQALAQDQGSPENNNVLLSQRMLENKRAYLAALFGQSSLEAEPETLARHFEELRRKELELMALDFWHPHRSKRYHTRRVAFVRKLLPQATATRFALHRRFGAAWAERQAAADADIDVDGALLDEEELDEFDGLGGISSFDITIPPWPRAPSSLGKMVRSASDATAISLPSSDDAPDSGPSTPGGHSIISAATTVASDIAAEIGTSDKVSIHTALAAGPVDATGAAAAPAIALMAPSPELGSSAQCGGTPSCRAEQRLAAVVVPRLVSFEPTVDDASKYPSKRSSISINQARAAAARGKGPSSSPLANAQAQQQQPRLLSPDNASGGNGINSAAAASAKKTKRRSLSIGGVPAAAWRKFNASFIAEEPAPGPALPPLPSSVAAAAGAQRSLQQQQDVKGQAALPAGRSSTLPRMLSFMRRKKLEESAFKTPPLPSNAAFRPAAGGAGVQEQQQGSNDVLQPMQTQTPTEDIAAPPHASSCYYSETGANCVKV